MLASLSPRHVCKLPTIKYSLKCRRQRFARHITYIHTICQQPISFMRLYAAYSRVHASARLEKSFILVECAGGEARTAAVAESCATAACQKYPVSCSSSAVAFKATSQRLYAERIQCIIHRLHKLFTRFL